MPYVAAIANKVKVGKRDGVYSGKRPIRVQGQYGNPEKRLLLRPMQAVAKDTTGKGMKSPHHKRSSGRKEKAPKLNLYEDKNIKYIDSSRMCDTGTDDIKKAFKMAKNPGKYGGKRRKVGLLLKSWPDAADFEKSGGIVGHIYRAKNLIDRRKLYVEAIEYLDMAIKYGLEEAFRNERESDQVLLARELRATCLFNLACFREAEREAANVLYWNPFNGKALYIYGESLYLQCKFERALMIFHRGFRLRTELYSKSFHNGIRKTTSSITLAIDAIGVLKEVENDEKHLASAERQLIEKSFHEEDFKTALKLETKEAGNNGCEKASLPIGNAILSKEEKSGKMEAKSAKTAKLRSKGELRRLEEDEAFLCSLSATFKPPDPPKNAYKSRAILDFEDFEWDFSVPQPKRGIFDQDIADLALDGLNFIKSRQIFWGLHSS